MILLFIAGLSGLITIPIGLIRVIRKRFIPNKLILLIGFGIGFYIGLILQQPIHSWDSRQRNLSGKIVTTELENYKNKYGHYPDSLTQLDLTQLNETLPKTYKIDRFIYYFKDGKYDLNIPILIMDRWHWNKDKYEFVYDDF